MTKFLQIDSPFGLHLQQDFKAHLKPQRGTKEEEEEL